MIGSLRRDEGYDMPDWQIFDKPLAYEPTISAMSAHVQAMQKG